MLPATAWRSFSETPPLRQSEVHLYRFRLDVTSLKRDLLAADEITRAEKLIDPLKQNHFISARSQLRSILSAYLGIHPKELVFRYNDFGKPVLSESHHSKLCFNLSHSANHCVVAVTAGVDIGVDIEKVDNNLNFHALSEQFFSKDELSVLLRTPLARQRRAFYRLWTAKEARLKMVGTGFSQQQPAQCSPLFGSHFYLSPHFVAAVACTDEMITIKKYQFSF